MSDSIIVTGGAGFIGSHVVDRLVEKGWRVHVVDDLSTGKRRNLDPAARLHVIDIRSRRLGALFRGCGRRSSSTSPLRSACAVRPMIRWPTPISTSWAL